LRQTRKTLELIGFGCQLPFLFREEKWLICPSGATVLAALGIALVVAHKLRRKSPRVVYDPFFAEGGLGPAFTPGNVKGDNCVPVCQARLRASSMLGGTQFKQEPRKRG
jgi:hypothetical protein